MISSFIPWFKKLQVRSKILLGVGSLVVLATVMIVTLYAALSVSISALDRVANEEEPTSAAAYEMEINVVKSGLKVMNYLRTGDLDYRKGALNDKEDFDYYLNRYNSVANNEAELAFGLQVGSLYSHYWNLGEQLMEERAILEASFSRSLEKISLTQASIDESLELIGNKNTESIARRQLLLQMKTRLAEMGKELGAYVRLGRESSRLEISEEAELFLVQLNYYKNLSLNTLQSDYTAKISTLFDSTHEAINDAVHFHQEAQGNLAIFFDLRAQLNSLLSEQMVPIAKNDLESANLYAEKTAKRVILGVILIAPIIILFSLLVVYVLTVSVTQPVEQLVAGAAAIGSGKLEYRISDLGEDELGQLAGQFNVMTQRLEQTTVSKNSLEASEAALRLSEERYARAVSGTNDGLFDWDMQSDKVYFSPRWRSMLGYSEQEITDDPESYFRIVHSDDIELLRHTISVYVNRPGEYLVNEHRILHSDGSYRWVQFRAVASTEPGNDRATRLSGSQTDIHAHKVAELQLVHDAMHDSLTGLPNRHLLLNRLQHFLDNTKRRKHETCGLLFLDLDGFKMVNDSLGHPAGDSLLVSLTQRLKKILGVADTLARFGGDEFAILAEGIRDEKDIVAIAQRVQKTLELPFETGNGKTFVGASIGIAISVENYTRAEDMLRDADIAMYRAKAAGKKRHVLFDDKMHGHVVERVQLETELRQALEREEFIIYYQPIIDLQNSRKLIGFEALLRWDHPQRGLIEPDEFIPLLEESGLIVAVGEWLLSTACRTVKSWHRANYTPAISVNVSAVQLREPGLVAAVNLALKNSGLLPQYLTLEITETNVMQNEVLARKLLGDVKQLGAKLSIDDFGVGYSSLSYLKRFPWDYVKIDRSFVRDISTNGKDAAIIEAITVMVHSLNFDIVAEGVEELTQLEALYKLGIDSVQGFLLARPAAAEHWEGLTSISSKKFLHHAFKRSDEQVFKFTGKRKA